MRILMIIRMPHEPFNSMVKDGSAGKRTEAIIKELNPEAVYFTEMNGLRTCVMVVEVKKSSMIPSLSEPWFLIFNADVEFHVAMRPEELKEAELDKLGKKWG